MNHIPWAITGKNVVRVKGGYFMKTTRDHELCLKGIHWLFKGIVVWYKRTSSREENDLFSFLSKHWPITYSYKELILQNSFTILSYTFYTQILLNKSFLRTGMFLYKCTPIKIDIFLLRIFVCFHSFGTMLQLINLTIKINVVVVRTFIAKFA